MRPVVALVCVSLLVACGAPIGVKRMDASQVQRQLTRSVLSADDLSSTTRNALFQNAAVDRFVTDPEGTIAEMHERVASGEARRNDIFALAELCFYHAEKTNDLAYDRAAAVYAYLFLFPENQEDAPDLLDARARIAADLYNRGLARGFATGPGGEFVPQQASYTLPFGELVVYFDAKELQRGQRRLVKFVPVAELEVEGLATRYRFSGLGAPLAASTEPLDPEKGYDDFVEPWAKVSVTAVLHMDDVAKQLAGGRVDSRLTLEEPVVRSTVELGGKEVPLETENTASLAYTLAESPVWAREIGGFLQRVGAIQKGTELASLSPHRPGRIPVVLVHGTASSPGRWAQMINELSNDRRIGPRVQFWLFMYDTGNPIGYSSMLLRTSLADAVKRLDPDENDAALNAMVVIGHSQGGLLTKTTAIDSGDAFWKNVSAEPFDSFDMSDEQRELVRGIAFVEPVPQVKRVVYLATPHRGSYVAGSWIAHQAARLIEMPANLTRISTDFLLRNRSKVDARFTGLSSSVMGMTPGSPMIETLVEIPLVPGVKSHSIIAVNDPDDPLEEAEDGVVAYESAHVDGVESELVVLSGHSCQDNPNTINEVRRILLEHIAEYDASQGIASEATAAAASPSEARKRTPAEPKRPAETSATPVSASPAR